MPSISPNDDLAPGEAIERSPLSALRRLEIALSAGEFGLARTIFDVMRREAESAGDRAPVCAYLAAIGVIAEALPDISAEGPPLVDQTVTLSGRWLDLPYAAFGELNLAVNEALSGILHAALGQTDIDTALIARGAIDVWNTRAAARVAETDAAHREAIPLFRIAAVTMPLITALAVRGRYDDAWPLVNRMAALRQVAQRVTEDSANADILDAFAALEATALIEVANAAHLMQTPSYVSFARRGLAVIEQAASRFSAMPKTREALAKTARAYA
jgi:hypothetical protein